MARERRDSMSRRCVVPAVVFFTVLAWLPATGANAQSVCGNGVFDAGEQCDDGDAISGDGCLSGCTIQSGWKCSGQPSVCQPKATCGNGIIEVGEQCDDGDAISGDGCQSTCTTQSGWTC